MMATVARDFIELLLRLMQESRSQDQFGFDLVDGVAIGDEAVIVGKTRPDGRVLGIALDVERYRQLFSGDVSLAAEAFVIELQEPGWAKGSLAATSVRSTLEVHYPGIWWVALTPPPP